MDQNQNTCKKCGTPLPTGATFCAACGTSQVEPAAPAAPAATPPTAPVTMPQTTAPQATAPQATAPQATAPQATAPQATAPQPTAPASPAAPTYAAPQAPAAPATNYGTSGTATPGYGAPGATTPGYTAPGATTSGYSAPGATTPGYSAPGTTTPGYTAPGTTTPGYSTPGATTPGYSTPGATTPGYSAPGTTAPGYNAPGYNAPGQPAGYGAPQQPYGTAAAGGYGGTPGYGQPGYGQPGYGAQPPAPPKKKGPLVPILIICGVLVIVVVAVILFMNNQKQKEIQAEYDALVTNICGSSSTSSVAAKENTLEAFKNTYPDFAVDADVEKLVDACVLYEDTADSENRFTDMLETLDDLSTSTNSQVADCAEKLIGGVQADYDAYLESLTPPEPESGEGGGGEDSESGTLSIDGVVEISGSSAVMDIVNSSPTKTVTYFEIIIFGYTASGEHVNGESQSYDLLGSSSDLTVAPNTTKPIEATVTYCANASFGIATICYIEYDDGTSYGTPIDYLSDASFLVLQALADIQAQQHVSGAAATLPASVSATLPCGPVFSLPEPKRVYGKAA